MVVGSPGEPKPIHLRLLDENRTVFRPSRTMDVDTYRTNRIMEAMVWSLEKRSALRILRLSMAGVGPDTFAGIRALKTLSVGGPGFLNRYFHVCWEDGSSMVLVEENASQAPSQKPDGFLLTDELSTLASPEVSCWK